MWHSLFQETLRQTSRRSGTKSHARLLTQHTLPVCWTRVPSAWRQGCAWTAAARASALCPVTSATWALGLRVLQNLCCSTSLKPRQSTSWSTATRPTRYLWVIMLYSHAAALTRLHTEAKQMDNVLVKLTVLVLLHQYSDGDTIVYCSLKTRCSIKEKMKWH